MKTKELTFTEKTIIDIVSKKIVDYNGGSYGACYLDKKGGYRSSSVCGVVFLKNNKEIKFTGPKNVVEKIAKECKQEWEELFAGIYRVQIPLRMFPTLALLAKVVKKG